MRILVPFDARDPKSRLDPLLDRPERVAFADAMLEDVLDVLSGAGHDPEVHATGPVDCGAPTTLDERELTPTVNSVLEATDDPVAVLMADLALLTEEALARLFEPTAEVVLAPGLGGGTNAIRCRHPAFRVDYHGTSYRDHLERARSCGASVATVDSFRLSCDIDRPEDLTEVLLHTDGAARAWLRDAGFELHLRNDRPTVTRPSSR